MTLEEIVPTLFDLTKDDIKTIAIFETYLSKNCFISKIDNKMRMFNGFILRNGPKAQTICNISFHPSSESGKYIPRLEFKVVHTKTGTEKESSSKYFVRIAFSSTGKDGDGCDKFWEMINFLSGFKELVDVGEFKGKYKVVDTKDYVAVFKTKTEAEQIQELSKMIQDSGLTDETIRRALSDKRKDSLVLFKKLLDDSSEFDKYKTEFSIKEAGEECVWHHFLKTNPWILGLSVDIRFIREFYPETNSGIPDTAGKGSPEVDMTGIRDYTVLIELKTSGTKIFTDKKKNTSRANTWSFSDDFIDGVSQCLGQKFDWDKNHITKGLVDPVTKNILSQDEIRTVDPKTIFVIGNKEVEIPQNIMNQENFWKRDTLERFRRNNRNIEIITYDELYERAHFIANGVNLNDK
jgi:hypothetical protein